MIRYDKIIRPQK